MTKKEYLESKGYIYDSEENIYKKTFSYTNSLGGIEYLVIGNINLVYQTYYLYVDCVETQKDIDSLQIAFNNLKSDYEECMKYE